MTDHQGGGWGRWSWRRCPPAVLLLVASLLVAACSSSPGALPTSSAETAPRGATGSTGSAPSASAGGGPVGGVDSVEEAIGAVGELDSNFLGYEPLDPNVIGASNWVEVEETADGYALVFVSGSGDCPAGCINRSNVKFTVARDGTVERRCEWHTGDQAAGTPC